jgi:hypothetical protein
VLRIDLQGTINRAALLTAVRNIKFRVSDSGASNIQQGNESLGRTIEAEVTGAGDIPNRLSSRAPCSAIQASAKRRSPWAATWKSCRLKRSFASARSPTKSSA